jgi:hypothetical protein
MKMTFCAEEQSFITETQIEASNLVEVLQRFTEFLRGAGFYFDGEIVLQTEEK